MIPALRNTVRQSALLLFFPTTGALGLQVPPAPRPAPAPRAPIVTPAPRPAPIDRWIDAPFGLEHLAPLPDFHFDAMRFDLEYDMKWKAEELKWKAEEFKWKNEDLKWKLDHELQSKFDDMAFHFDAPAPAPMPPVHFDVPVAPMPTPRPAPRPAMPPRLMDFESALPMVRGRDGMRPIASVPREPWAGQDSADSMYKNARELLNRGEWRRAATAFAVIPQRYPGSAYAPDALYWQAFALYRIGGTSDLRDALRALETQRSKYPQARSRDEQTDSSALMARIQGALAQRGDASAERQINTLAQNPTQSCDREEQAVRAEALRALAQTDPATVTTSVRKVLARRDECSATLRRSAVYLIGQSGDSSATSILADVAQNDPSPEVRSSAISWLSRAGDRGVPTLEEILRTSTDERMQRAAARALAANASPRARQAVRALLERNDVSERIRIEAIAGFQNERATEEDAAYLRGLYAKVESPRVKERIVRTIGELGGPANEEWLLALMRNNDEPLEVRSAALSRVASRNMPIAEAVKLYDAVADRQLRERLISVYGQRKEPEATDKLLEIVRGGTDPRLRTLAINALTRKNDPRTTRLLLEIIDK
jgi:HEAT repeat protein